MNAKNSEGEKEYPYIFKPAEIGNLTLKNRVVMAPMGTNLAGKMGETTEQLIKYYTRRTQGGVGTIIVEGGQVQWPEGKNLPCPLNISEDTYIDGLKKLVNSIKNYGTTVFLQLVHAGGQTNKAFTEGKTPVVPSQVKGRGRKLEIEEIKKIEDLFAQGAKRAAQAGFDGVEIHAAHGYLVNQFLSPSKNTRNDEYGGSLEGRTRLALNIIKKTKSLCKDFPLSIRMSVEEFFDKGISISDSKKIVPKFESAGIDVFHVTSGTSETLRTSIEPITCEEGWRSYLAQEIKKLIEIPVITVGVYRSPSIVNKVLAEGKADLVAIGRGLLSDPDWVNKVKTGETEKIRKCISCNHCVYCEVYKGKKIRCAINPVAGVEEIWSKLNDVPKNRILIAGGGPGGIQAAITGAKLNQDVTLFEEDAELGGCLRLAAIPPKKDKIGWFLNWQIDELLKSGAKVKTNEKFSPEKIKKKPDAVIIATGADPITPPISGIEKGMQARKALKEDNFKGEKAVVLGGGLVGCETALYLSEKGLKVSIVEMMEEILIELKEDNPQYRDVLIDELRDAKVEIKTNFTASQALRDVLVSDEGEKVEYDNLIIAAGEKPRNDLSENLNNDINIYKIGSAKNPRRIGHAVLEGFESILKIVGAQT